MQQLNNQLQLFKYHNNSVRTFTHNDGSIWLIAADVCRVLDIKNPRDAVNSLDDDEKMTVAITDGHSGQRGGAQFFNIINESGFYALVFKSRKEEAKDFSRWVRREVLPSIRQHGYFVSDVKINSLDTNDRAIKEILSENKFLRAENTRLHSQIEANKPKLALAEFVCSTAGSVTFQEASIFLTQHGIKKIGQNSLFKLLRERGLLCSRRGKQWNHPTAKAAQLGYFSVEISGNRGRTVTMITQKFLLSLLDELTNQQLPLVYLINESNKEEK